MDELKQAYSDVLEHMNDCYIKLYKEYEKSKKYIMVLSLVTFLLCCSLLVLITEFIEFCFVVKLYVYCRRGKLQTKIMIYDSS